MPEPPATCIECGKPLTECDTDSCGACEAKRVEEELMEEALRLDVETMLRKDDDGKRA